MSKELSSGFSEVCAVDVSPNTDVKRFGKLFCSLEHTEKYTKARQKARGEEEGYEENRVKEREKGWCSTLKGFLTRLLLGELMFFLKGTLKILVDQHSCKCLTNY